MKKKISKISKISKIGCNINFKFDIDGDGMSLDLADGFVCFLEDYMRDAYKNWLYAYGDLVKISNDKFGYKVEIKDKR